MMRIRDLLRNKLRGLVAQPPIPDMVIEAIHNPDNGKVKPILPVDIYVRYMAEKRYVNKIVHDYKINSLHLPALLRLVKLHAQNFHMYEKMYCDESLVKTEIQNLLHKIESMTIIFYKYYFTGKEKPVVIEAISRDAADRKIEDLAPELLKQGYDCKEICNISCEEPIVGVSRKTVNGIEYVWVAGLSPSGWQPVNTQ